MHKEVWLLVSDCTMAAVSGKVIEQDEDLASYLPPSPLPDTLHTHDQPKDEVQNYPHVNGRTYFKIKQ